MTADPIIFHPLYQQRVWGGRYMASQLGRSLPDDGLPYGEAWEIVDRPEAQSIVDGGRWDGFDLHTLWTVHRREVFGVEAGSDRFPVLCKVLDARDKLSVQVHPPAAVCAQLKGESKDEIWYILDATPGAELYAGLKQGVTRADFESALAAGGMARLLHVLRPATGESLFLPSGRLHAIGAGFLILEIQQNSDTTYRVYDWDRLGLDGKPRDMHVAQATRATDFNDFEPAMRPGDDGELVRCRDFFVEQHTLAAGASHDATADGTFRLLAVADGHVQCAGTILGPGGFALLPVGAAPLLATDGAVILLAGLP